MHITLFLLKKRSKDSEPIKLWNKKLEKLKKFNLENYDISVIKSVCRVKVKYFRTLRFLLQILFKSLDQVTSLTVLPNGSLTPE
jgi:hypothetical protein